jgi:methylaspartate mutase sigma subunit
MTGRVERQPHVLLSSVSSDSHTWNLVYLTLLLEEHGYEVTNLGSCVPDDLLIRTARQERPDAIVISSVNGHGRIDGDRVVRKLRMDADTARIPAVIGGKLGITGAGVEADAELLDAGFTAVFGDTDARELITALADMIGATTPQQGVSAR